MAEPREELELPDEVQGESEEDAAQVDALEDDGEDGEDAGQDDPTGEEGDEAQEVGEPQRRQPSRATRRVNAALKEAREARASSQRLETEIARLRAERQAPQSRLSPEDEAIQERERLAIMTPEERTEYRLDKAQRNMERQLQQMHFQNQDTLDKAQYEARAAADPRYRRYETEVNTRVAELRAAGQNVSRDAVLKFIIGEKVLARQATGTPKPAARARVVGQQARNVNGRGDVQPQRGRESASSPAAVAKRLENMQL